MTEARRGYMTSFPSRHLPTSHRSVQRKGAVLGHDRLTLGLPEKLNRGYCDLARHGPRRPGHRLADLQDTPADGNAWG
jgi:hypothetical protein